MCVVKRLAIVTTSYPRAPKDYAGAFVAEHASWLVSQGMGVHVVAAAPGAIRPPDNGLPPIGLAVRRGAQLFARGGAPEALASCCAWPRGGTFLLAQALAVRRSLRDCHGVVAHWLVPSALSVALGCKLPMTAVCHSGDLHLLLRLRLVPTIARLLAHRRAKLVFVSHPLKDAFLGAIASRRVRRQLSTQVTPMGVFWRRFADMAALPRGDRFRVLFLGRLVAVKGLDILARASEGIARHHSDIEIVVAGQGPLRSLVEKAPHLHYAGSADTSRRDRLLATANALVLPSRVLPDGRTEGTPRIAIEALAAGRPVIASAVGGLSALGEALFLVPPDCPQALIAAILALKESSVAHQRLLSAKARKFARRFDWSQVGPQLLPESFSIG